MKEDLIPKILMYVLAVVVTVAVVGGISYLFIFIIQGDWKITGGFFVMEGEITPLNVLLTIVVWSLFGLWAYFMFNLVKTFKELRREYAKQEVSE